MACTSLLQWLLHLQTRITSDGHRQVGREKFRFYAALLLSDLHGPARTVGVISTFVSHATAQGPRGFSTNKVWDPFRPLVVFISSFIFLFYFLYIYIYIQVDGTSYVYIAMKCNGFLQRWTLLEAKKRA